MGIKKKLMSHSALPLLAEQYYKEGKSVAQSPAMK